MVRTIASILISFLIIFGFSFYEVCYVRNTFSEFYEIVNSLYQKTESHIATYEDGTAAEKFWENQKNTLHIWLPHTAIQEIDYQLYEAVGYLYVRDYDSAMPKIEILIGMCKNIPQSYRFSLENIL